MGSRQIFRICKQLLLELPLRLNPFLQRYKVFEKTDTIRERYKRRMVL